MHAKKQQPQLTALKLAQIDFDYFSSQIVIRSPKMERPARFPR